MTDVSSICTILTQMAESETWVDGLLAWPRVSELSCMVATYSALYAGMLWPSTCTGMHVLSPHRPLAVSE